MALDEVTIDELLGKLRSGHIGNINDYYRKVFIDFLEELYTLRVKLENNSKELEVYKLALDYLASNCAILDMLAYPNSEDVCFTADRWKAIALMMVRKEDENNRETKSGN